MHASFENFPQIDSHRRSVWIDLPWLRRPLVFTGVGPLLAVLESAGVCAFNGFSELLPLIAFLAFVVGLVASAVSGLVDSMLHRLPALLRANTTALSGALFVIVPAVVLFGSKPPKVAFDVGVVNAFNMCACSLLSRVSRRDKYRPASC